MGKTYSFLATPRLSLKVKKYFQCESIVGAAMQDEGGDGSQGSHFERSIFMDEFMTASGAPEQYVTDFTFALLEDTGFYKVDYSNLDQLVWGKY